MGKINLVLYPYITLFLTMLSHISYCRGMPPLIKAYLETASPNIFASIPGSLPLASNVHYSLS
jgi:hypothetical protein